LEETAAPQSSTPTPAAPSSSTHTEDQVQEETNSQDLEEVSYELSKFYNSAVPVN